jgi:hypothetical protein
MKQDPDDDTMRDEYDFSQGVRGKYVGRIREGALPVVLEPDVAREFPDSKAVNAALRAVIRARAPHPPA